MITTYIIISFLTIKIISAFAVESIKKFQRDRKNQRKEFKTDYEKDLNLKAGLFEEFRSKVKIKDLI